MSIVIFHYYLDGKLQRMVKTNRVVGARADGTHYITVQGKRKNVNSEEDGSFTYESHARTVQQPSLRDTLLSITRRGTNLDPTCGQDET